MSCFTTMLAHTLLTEKPSLALSITASSKLLSLPLKHCIWANPPICVTLSPGTGLHATFIHPLETLLLFRISLSRLVQFPTLLQLFGIPYMNFMHVPTFVPFVVNSKLFSFPLSYLTFLSDHLLRITDLAPYWISFSAAYSSVSSACSCICCWDIPDIIILMRNWTLNSWIGLKVDAVYDWYKLSSLWFCMV